VLCNKNTIKRGKWNFNLGKQHQDRKMENNSAKGISQPNDVDVR
jgi:hypothetical protein